MKIIQIKIKLKNSIFFDKFIFCLWIFDKFLSSLNAIQLQSVFLINFYSLTVGRSIFHRTFVSISCFTVSCSLQFFLGLTFHTLETEALPIQATVDFVWQPFLETISAILCIRILLKSMGKQWQSPNHLAAPNALLSNVLRQISLNGKEMEGNISEWLIKIVLLGHLYRYG